MDLSARFIISPIRKVEDIVRCPRSSFTVLLRGLVTNDWPISRSITTAVTSKWILAKLTWIPTSVDTQPYCRSRVVCRSALWCSGIARYRLIFGFQMVGVSNFIKQSWSDHPSNA